MFTWLRNKNIKGIQKKASFIPLLLFSKPETLDLGVLAERLKCFLKQYKNVLVQRQGDQKGKAVVESGGKFKCWESILIRSFHLFTSPGVTPVDGTPHRPYSECYPVLLDGVMIGWADKEIAPGIADSLRHFKVILSLCELFCPSILGFHVFSDC